MERRVPIVLHDSMASGHSLRPKIEQNRIIFMLLSVVLVDVLQGVMA
jgi:hypothetical protein